MKKILVPCDFSKQAVNAFCFALDIANQSNGVVHLIHVIEMPVIKDPLLIPVPDFEETLVQELGANVKNEFAKLVAKYNTKGVNVITAVEFGAPGRMILAYAEQKCVDIIIMGSRGASGVKEILFGSNAEKVVRRAKVPVLVVKDQHQGMIKQIVFPNTLALDHQEDLAMKVKSLQHFFQAHLHIVWINTHGGEFNSDRLAFERLTAFAKRFMFKDYSIHVYNHPDEEEGILKFTEAVRGNIIAMGTHSRSGLAHIMKGSLAENVVNYAEKLIWTYTLTNDSVTA